MHEAVTGLLDLVSYYRVVGGWDGKPLLLILATRVFILHCYIHPWVRHVDI
jgi:hypothetical protein